MPASDSTGHRELLSRRLRLEEYHQFVAVGVLGEDEPLELLEGGGRRWRIRGEPMRR